ncbi:hypothetical protein IQ07DRAFT_358284 [Pyrenochaeta sp. DS3sAY3a]|nr:hypothetical protein IQ07DRAFT_358284 [Pyrenochaeta sp. DS3sAY3a]
MSPAGYGNSPIEGWQDLVAWDDELYDPIFHGDTGFTGSQTDSFSTSFQEPGSFTSDQPYLVSAPPSIADGPPSLEYTVSAPPSILDGQSSFGQPYCTSPSFGTDATSPLVGREDGRFFGSFGACDSILTPLDRVTEPPILDTRYERIADSYGGSTGSYESTSETVFNPYVAGSAHSFSGLDVRASQAFSSVGTWADQPQIVEPITELDETRVGAAPISIPQPLYHGFSSASYQRSAGASQPYLPSRAITIPEATRGTSSYNHTSSASSRRVPPLFSVSPTISRRYRGVALSRSTSQSRRKPTTPSPTSATSDSFGWVSYQPNPVTNRLAPTSTEGLQGRTPRGRKKGLTAEQRSHAALMRIIGACSNCQRRKEKCDPGTPCKSCLEHYKGDLVKNPCRDRLLSDLSSAFLSDRLGWHPTARSLASFIAPQGFNISTGITYWIPLNFGFGPPMSVSVNALHIENPEALVHKHIIYSWPPESSHGSTHHHAVLPAVLTADVTANLFQALDTHLSLLVTHHFRLFPLFCSPLRILREVYIFWRSLAPRSPGARTLHQALKLLVLVHVGGDITLPPRSENAVLSQLIRSTIPLSDDLQPTPCFIRAQFGAVMPGLALHLMKDVLASLEQLLLNRDCDDWPLALALLITVLMTVESIQYHAAKTPYHANYDSASSPSSSSPSAGAAALADDDMAPNNEGVKTMLAFYTACFSGCHARLRPDWAGEVRATGLGIPGREKVAPGDAFVESVRGCIGQASGEGYLSVKVGEKRGEDMGFWFDRLVAGLLVLRV